MISTIDLRLIDNCLQGRRGAHRALYDLTLPYYTAVAYRYLVDDRHLQDTLQVTYGRLFTALDRFDSTRASFKTWSTKLLINECLKQNARDRRFSVDELTAAHDGFATPPEALVRLSNEDLIAWLKQMPQSYYQVFSLYVIDGFSHEEIGEILGISTVLSRKRLSRSRRWLKDRAPSQLTGVLTILPDLAGNSLAVSIALIAQLMVNLAIDVHPSFNCVL